MDLPGTRTFNQYLWTHGQLLLVEVEPELHLFPHLAVEKIQFWAGINSVITDGSTTVTGGLGGGLGGGPILHNHHGRPQAGQPGGSGGGGQGGRNRTPEVTWSVQPEHSLCSQGNPGGIGTYNCAGSPSGGGTGGGGATGEQLEVRVEQPHKFRWTGWTWNKLRV